MRNCSLAVVMLAASFAAPADGATLEKGSAVAAAVTPTETSPLAYEGAWGRSAADCANTADFFVNTLIHGSRFIQYELSCTIEGKERTGIGQSRLTWLLNMDCDLEGDEIEMTAQLTVEAPDRLIIEKSRGTYETYRRCTGPIPPEYRSVFED